MSPAADWRSLYPFASHEIVLDGHRYHYLDEGTGPPLVLVHGNPTWSFYWRELVRGLRGRYRVLVPDHIGCGLSDKPDPRSYSYRLAQRVDDLVEWIEQLDFVRSRWWATIGAGPSAWGPPWPCRAVRPLRALQHGRLSGRGMPGVDPPVPRAAAGPADDPRAEPVRPGGVALGRRTPRAHDAGGPAGLLAPYDTWQHRVAIDRFVNDIPLHPGHPSYPALVQIEEGLAQFHHYPVCLIWGMATGASGRSFSNASGNFSPPPRSIVWPTPGITWSRMPTSGSCRWSRIFSPATPSPRKRPRRSHETMESIASASPTRT